jgi:hypothetical protein
MLEEEKIKELKEELKKLNEYRNSIISTIENLQKEIDLNKFKGKYFKITNEYNNIYYISVSNIGKVFEFVFYSGQSYSFGFNFSATEYISSVLYNTDKKDVQELTKEEYKKDLFETIEKHTKLVKQKVDEKIP